MPALRVIDAVSFEATHREAEFLNVPVATAVGKAETRAGLRTDVSRVASNGKAYQAIMGWPRWAGPL